MMGPTGRPRILVQPRGRTFLPGTPAEWTGVFVFGVGVYGATYRPITRHLTIWGFLPLDWFYLVLLLLGAGLMLFGGEPASPDAEAAAPGRGARFWLGLRIGISFALLAALVWWSIAR
jgi:hypothetical protein